MELTVNQIKRIYPYEVWGWSDAKIEKLINKYLPYINRHLPNYFISTPIRVAHFLAQVLHESGGFRYQKELASGKAYDTGRLAINLGNTPEADGDGQLYKGRGLIQLTGRANYKAFQDWLGGLPEVYNKPELIEQPNLAVLAAVFYWDSRSLNKLADMDDIKQITKRVNGGYNGLDDRKLILNRAKMVFNIK